jgi:hypothetical protein
MNRNMNAHRGSRILLLYFLVHEVDTYHKASGIAVFQY